MAKIYRNSTLLFILLIIIVGCSTDKNTFVSRTYHNLTAHYNVYFNGNESFKNGVKRIENLYVDNYARILNPFKYSDEKISKTAIPDMDKTIKKCSKLIKLHSITDKPKRKKGRMSKSEKEFYNKNEYNRWVDDSYLLMGKAHFYKHDYYNATQTFEYVIKEYNEEPIKYDAYLWLVRTCNEEKKFGDARSYLDRFENDKEFPKRLKAEYEMVFADHFLKQQNFGEAIPHLEKGIKLTKKQSLRARYTFILAQVYQQLGENGKATDMYGKVIKMNPYYELTFNAKINRANTYNSGDESGIEIKKELSKMLKDEKNIDYQDQIYYALANIAMKEGQENKALDLYKMAAKTSSNNANQKARTCLAIADIYFDRRDYQNAQPYYDSTMLFLETDFPDYNKISQKAKNLTNLVDNLKVIDYQDSLQKISKLSESERNKLIDKLIEKVKEDERKQKEQEQRTMMNSALFKQNQRDPRMNSLTSGKWYFYNPTAMSYGQSEFLKVWGRRKLEDNWRRKNKNVIAFDENAEENEAESDSIVELRKKQNDNKSREYYTKDLLLSDSLINLSNEKIIDAYFNVGEIYKNDIEDYSESEKAFKKLNDRFKNHKYLINSYYYLYDIGEIVEDQQLSTEYRNKIISEFPNSKFTRMFTNPNYLEEFDNEQKQATTLYTETYNLYSKKNYKSVIGKCNQAENQFKESELIPKFLFLKAMSLGETNDQEQMIKILENIVKDFPKSEVKPPATDILTFINKNKKKDETSVKKEEIKAEEIAKPDSTAEQLYTDNQRSQHMFVVVVNRKVDINRMKFDVSNFNLDFFNTSNLNTSNILLNNDYQLIIVKTFETKKQSVNYYNTVKLKAEELFKTYLATDYQYFVISVDNYPILYKDQDVNRYLNFFKIHYSIENQKN